MRELKTKVISFFLILTILISGSGCASLTQQKTYRSNSDCEVEFLNKETLIYIKKHKPSSTVKANIARNQIANHINNNLNNREPITISKELGWKKYAIATGAVVVGWYIGVKLIVGGLFSWVGKLFI